MHHNQIIAVLLEHGFAEGRLIAMSKSGYCKRHRSRFAVFNAQVCNLHGRLLKQADPDLTLDGEKLTQVARFVGGRGHPVRPVCYHRVGLLDHVWFCHGATVPAILYDHAVLLLDSVSFTWHRDSSAIHLRQTGEVVGLCWPCGISTPEIFANARRQLRPGTLEKTQ